MEELLSGLTPAQRQAVTHGPGPLLILAGPGSGKTRVVTHRIAWLVRQGTPGTRILGLTFTNKAAEEMRARLDRLAPDSGVWLGTFHRFCAHLLRRYGWVVGLGPNFTIYDDADSLQALRHVLAASSLKACAPLAPAILHAVHWAKGRLIAPEQYQPRSGNVLGQVVQEVYPLYQEHLLRSNAADFDDLLFHVAALLREDVELRAELDQRYEYILVDEYQDTNLAQYAIARSLSIDQPNLAVTGDPDQSIYGWRGANLNNILEFERDFPGVRVIRLEQNYRSTQRILRVAARLIAHNVRRKEKALFTENGQGGAVRLVLYSTHEAEARYIAAEIARQVRRGRRRARDFAIFYRINALSRAFEIALRQEGVPYQLVRSVEFFQREEIKDVLAYLQLLNNPHDQVAFLRVVNRPRRGIGKASIERLAAHATRRGLTMLEAARRASEVEGLGRQPARKLAQFAGLVDRLLGVAGGAVEEVLGHVLTETGYRQQYDIPGDEIAQQRLANIDELLTVARNFDERRGAEAGLEAFLEETALVSDTDQWQADADRVTLMTLHASKGLEFPVVFLVAVEEGLLPHERSRDDPDQMEEERRLMFVGITRAQGELQISMAGYRDFRGRRRMSVPSSFLMELPRAEMEVVSMDDDGHEAALAGPIGSILRRPSGSDGRTARPTVTTASAPGAQPTARFSAKTLADAPLGAKAGETAASSAVAARLTTAAELAGDQGAAPGPEVFHQGMLVRHPQLGLGHVVALSGSGPERTATVDFLSPAVRRKFRLQDGPLRPVEPQA